MRVVVIRRYFGAPDVIGGNAVFGIRFGFWRFAGQTGKHVFDADLRDFKRIAQFLDVRIPTAELGA